VKEEVTVAGLAIFIAYHGKSIKAIFEDRTIVRMLAGSDIVRVLTRLGDEVVFNL
jgi:hypothetical protein